MDFFDHIQHDYAIRHVNANSGAYEYRTLVRSGTAYPTDEAVDEVTVKASYDGQQELGIAIYELAVKLIANDPIEQAPLVELGTFESLVFERLDYLVANLRRYFLSDFFNHPLFYAFLPNIFADLGGNLRFKLEAKRPINVRAQVVVEKGNLLVADLLDGVTRVLLRQPWMRTCRRSWITALV